MRNATTNQLTVFQKFGRKWIRAVGGKTICLVIALPVVMSLFVISTLGYGFIEELDLLESLCLKNIFLTTIG